jgi:hypothetical protein
LIGELTGEFTFERCILVSTFLLFYRTARGFPISPRNIRRKKEQNIIRQARGKAKKGFCLFTLRAECFTCGYESPGAFSGATATSMAQHNHRTASE